MDKVHEELMENVKSVKEFKILEENLRTEISRRKNWAAPGIYGIQHFLWKELKPATTILGLMFEKVIEDSCVIPIWWPSGRTVLIPKTKDLSDEKNYCLIICLNISY